MRAICLSVPRAVCPAVRRIEYYNLESAFVLLYRSPVPK